MPTKLSTQHDIDLAWSVSPEDLKRGEYVVILDVIMEYPSFCWGCETQGLGPHDVVRIPLCNETPGRPLKVKEICLPFVLVKTPEGRHETLDVRQCKLVRVSDRYARATCKAVRQSLPAQQA